MTKTDIRLPEPSEQEAAQLLENTIATARKQLETLVDGNGLHKSAVRVSEKTLKLDVISLEAKGRLIPVDQETTLPGKQTKGLVLTDRRALKTTVDEQIENLEKDDKHRQLIYLKMKELKFGIDGEQTVAFEAPPLEFSFIEDCAPCKGQGKSTCQACQGRGQEPCTKCKATGQITCFNCRGLKKIQGPDGHKEECTECQGFGMTPCPNCRESKYLPCKACQQTGTQSCKDCNGSGTQTTLITVSFKLQVSGKISVPPEMDVLYQKARERYTDTGLIDKGHIQFKDTDHIVESENGYLYATLAGYIPHGTISFSLNGKRVDADVFGVKGALFTDDLFLDSLVKSGISALNKIARGPMATGALFQQARSYRMLRDITNQVSSQSRRKILYQIRKDYPIGLSDKYAKIAVKLADDAMRKVMVKPRWTGCLIGIGLFGALIGAWFHLGLRPEGLQNGDLNLQIFADVTLLGLGVVATGYLIKFLTRNTLQKILNKAPDRLPAAGDQSLIAFAALLLIFLVAGATSPADPLWWSQFF